jgi:hypothetical protein
MSTPVINSDDTVALTNESTEELRLAYHGRHFRIAPGSTATVPFGLVIKDFGDPRSGPTKRTYIDDQGTKGQIPSRDYELTRLAGLYGLETYNEKLKAEAEEKKKPPPEGAPLDAVAPKVTIKTALGEEILTPVHDPKGDNAIQTVTNLDSPSSVAAEVARLAQQLDALKERQDAMANLPNPDSGQEVTEDGPGFEPPSS